MRRRGTLVALVLTAALCGCGSDSEPAPEMGPPPASGAKPPSLGDDAFAVRDTLVGKVHEAGGAHLEVTGLPSETTLDMTYDQDRQGFARRFTWEQDGETRELIETAGGRVCANLAAATALQSLGNNVQGAIGPSDRPWSCSTGNTSVGPFVIRGYSMRDPISRLAGLMGPVAVDDLGVETDASGVVTRHLRLRAAETDSTLASVPTRFDLWVDADQRLVRAEFTNLDGTGEAHVATISYDDLDAVRLPPAADRGDFVSFTGSGVPGFGGYLLSQFCPDPTEPCEPPSPG